MAEKTERWVRRNLRLAAHVGGLGNPNAAALIHGTLAGLHRSGNPIPADTLSRWASDEGWPDDALPVLRGLGLAAEFALPDVGELTTTRAEDGRLVVHLTRDEARAAHGALREVLIGPYAIPPSEFHTLMGFRPDEARVVLEALGNALSDARD
jgi:hypothetical protein